MTTDDEHLRLLSIFHYIVGGLAALFSFFPLLYGAMGLFILLAPEHPTHGEPPPHLLGWFFVGFGCFFFLLGLVFAICVAFSGRFIKRRRRYWYSFIIACIECLFFPFGVVLGVFTIIVFSRRSVKELYGLETATPSVASNVQAGCAGK
ncbi:MAG: hypothetical protein ACREIF_07275 [Chthoniobacterales bacterium]